MKIKIFTATWCSSCKIVKPLLTKNNIEFEELGVDDPEIAAYAKSIGVRALPTIIKVNNYEVIDKLIGKVTESQIREFIK